MIIDLNQARLARGLPVPVLPAALFLPPAGKRIGDRVFIPSCGVFGFVMTATKRRAMGAFGEWTLRINSSGVTYSVGEFAVDAAPESARG